MLRLDGCKVSQLERIASFSSVDMTSENVVVVVKDVVHGLVLSVPFLVDRRRYTSKGGYSSPSTIDQLRKNKVGESGSGLELLVGNMSVEREKEKQIVARCVWPCVL